MDILGLPTNVPEMENIIKSVLNTACDFQIGKGALLSQMMGVAFWTFSSIRLLFSKLFFVHTMQFKKCGVD